MCVMSKKFWAMLNTDISETERRKRRSLYAFHDVKKGGSFY